MKTTRQKRPDRVICKWGKFTVEVFENNKQKDFDLSESFTHGNNGGVKTSYLDMGDNSTAKVATNTPFTKPNNEYAKKLTKKQTKEMIYVIKNTPSPTKPNNKWSKNDRAEKICGKRKIPKNTIIFDQPCELDYHCPVCKYKNVVNGNYDERLEWSEYNDFIWCRVCNKDYPSILCMPVDKAIDAYLKTLQQQRKDLIKEIEGIVGEDEEIRNYMDINNGYVHIECDKQSRNQLRKEIRERLLLIK